MTVLPHVDERRAGRVSSWARVALGLWLGSMLVLGAGLLAKHVVALPAPDKNPRLSRALTPLRHAGEARWLAVHVLYAECRCSQRVVAHLSSTRRPRGWQEVVLWVGAPAPDPALAGAFDVRRATQAELLRFGIESAPLLVVLDPNDRAVYVGGYTDRKQGPVIRDLEILADAERRSELTSLPVFGCAVSDRLKRALSVLPTP